MSQDSSERASWLDRLGEASLLEPGDPLRQEVEAEVARRGGLARAQWLSLLNESEQLRLALAQVDPPDGLAGRLMEIPCQHSGWRIGWVRTSAGRWALAGALVAVVAVGATSLVRRGTPSDPVDEIASLAVQDHAKTHTWEVRAETPEALATALQPKIPFPVLVPTLGPGLVPEGGRRCTLASQPAAFTSWRGAHGRLTLLQVRRSAFSLPEMPRAQRVRRVEPVLVFGANEFAWIVVADDPRDLASVEQAVNAQPLR